MPLKMPTGSICPLETLMELSDFLALLLACAVVIAGAWFVAEIAWWLIDGDKSDECGH